MKSEKKSRLITITSKFINFAFIFIIIISALFLIGTFYFIKSFSSTSHQLSEIYIFESIEPLIRSIYIAIILYYLNKIFKNFKSDNFFAPANIKNIKIIGYIVLLFYALISMHDIYQHFLAFTTLSMIGLPFALKWEGFLIGLIILVIAEAFKRGEIIKNEQDLTV